MTELQSLIDDSKRGILNVQSQDLKELYSDKPSPETVLTAFGLYTMFAKYTSGAYCMLVRKKNYPTMWDISNHIFDNVSLL